MSVRHTSKDDLNGYSRETLRRMAARVRRGTVGAAGHAVAHGRKRRKRGIATRLRETPGALSKRLSAQGRVGPRGLPRRRLPHFPRPVSGRTARAPLIVRGRAPRSDSMSARRSRRPATTSTTSPRSRWRRSSVTSDRTKVPFGMAGHRR